MTSEDGTENVETGDLAAASDRQVERRDVVRGLLGAFGAVLGAQFLAGCAGQEATEGPTGTGTTSQKLTGANAIWFDTIEGAGGLRQSSVLLLTANQVAIVEGYWAPGDGGGGVFYWDPGLPGGTDNGGTVIVAGAPPAAPGTVGQCWRRVHSGPLSVRWFGAKGDGTDPVGEGNAQRIERAVRHLSTESGGLGEAPAGVVEFPGGDYQGGFYKCNEPLVFEYRVNVVWKGPAEIRYTGGTSTDFISLKGVSRWSFDDLIFTYSSPNFTGSLFQTAQGSPPPPAEPAPTDATYIRWNRCWFAAASTLGSDPANWNSAACLALDFAYNVSIRDCTFATARTGVRGRRPSPNGGFTNVVTIAGCAFHRLGTCILNGGESWTIIGNNFSPTQDGVNLLASGAYDQELEPDAYNVWNFSFIGNYLGDGGSSARPRVRIKGYGINISGNMMKAGQSDDTVLQIAESQGVSIAGNVFYGAIAFLGSIPGRVFAPSDGVIISGNTSHGADGPFLLGTQNVNTLNVIGNQALGGEGGNDGNVITLPMKVKGTHAEGTFWRMHAHIVRPADAYPFTPAPNPIPAGGYAEGTVVFAGKLGDPISVGISPALPDGCVISASMVTQDWARITIQNLRSPAAYPNPADAVVTIAESTVQLFGVGSTSGPA